MHWNIMLTFCGQIKLKTGYLVRWVLFCWLCFVFLQPLYFCEKGKGLNWMLHIHFIIFFFKLPPCPQQCETLRYRYNDALIMIYWYNEASCKLKHSGIPHKVWLKQLCTWYFFKDNNNSTNNIFLFGWYNLFLAF